MNTPNYPNWLVPLDIAQELKAIGFDEPCHFYYQNDYSEYLKAGDPDKYHIISDSLAANRKNANHNIYEIAISLPTWEQVFEWFREKGFITNIYYKEDLISEETMFIGEICNTKADIISIIHECSAYEEAREALVKSLIRTYKSEQLK